MFYHVSFKPRLNPLSVVVVYEGKAQIVATIKGVGKCSLFLVGCRRLTLTILVLERKAADCSELGSVGSYLASLEL